MNHNNRLTLDMSATLGAMVMMVLVVGCASQQPMGQEAGGGCLGSILQSKMSRDCPSG